MDTISSSVMILDERAIMNSSGGIDAIGMVTELLLGLPSPGHRRLAARLSGFWMQTTGAALLATKQCSAMRLSMPAESCRRAPRLLYLAAVQAVTRCSGTEPGDELDLDGDADRQLG